MVYHDHNKSGTDYSNFFDGNSKTIGPFLPMQSLNTPWN